MKELLELFSIFARIGCFTFGGGYAMLPMLQKEVVEKNKWATEEEIMDYYAIGQCTPGIIAVNTATFIGYKQKGLLGALFATGGMVFPSLVIITVIATFIQNFAQLEIVSHAFSGIRVAVCLLVLNAVIKMWKTSVVDKLGLIIFILVFIFTAFLNISPVYVVIATALTGIISKKVGGNK